MNQLNFNVISNGKKLPLTFNLQRMINVAFAGRNQKAVQAHIDELAKEGVAPPPSIPALYGIPTAFINQNSEIEVTGAKTSGEIEFTILLQGGKTYIGVGSDHTDRELEVASILASKQVCPNIISKDLWDYDEIKDHWDEIELRSFTKEPGSSKEIPYQKAPLSSILSVEEILKFVKSKSSNTPSDGLLIYSGTVAIIPHKMIFSDYFRCELHDPKLKRSLGFEYKISKLDYITV